jgi:hypothetical protein
MTGVLKGTPGGSWDFLEEETFETSWQRQGMARA